MRSWLRLLVLVALAGPASGSPPDPGTLRLKAASFDPTAGVPSPALPAVAGHAPGTRGGYWVQFERPIRGADREALATAGASVKGYVPMHALEVVMTEAERDAVAAVPGVRFVGPVQPGLKLAAILTDRLAGGDPSDRLLLQVSLFPGEDTEAAAQLSRAGARIVRIEATRSQTLATVELAAARLEALARAPLVRFVEPVYKRQTHNDRARFYSGLSQVADDTFAAGLDPSLDGFDESVPFQVKFGHVDGGLSSSHPDFQTGITNGWITLETGANTTDAHGTHTAASIVGDGGQWSTVVGVPPASGSISQDRWRGVAPQAGLHHISFQNNLTDVETLKRLAAVGTHVSSNSWGYCNPQGPFRCNSITDYNTNAALWDDGVWDADGDLAGQQPLIVVFSAGNDGDGDGTGCATTGNDQVGTPGTAKNVITVAANETDRGCNVWADHVGDVIDFSSRGPVDPDGNQGLFKPDVTLIGGDFVLSAEASGSGGSGRDDPTACSDTGPHYRYEGGTSMSTPLTAGLAGLLVQDLVANRGVAAPPPSLVKGLLINGAVDLVPSGGCDYTFETDADAIHQGWGLVQAPGSLYGPGGSPDRRTIHFDAEVTANALATGENYQSTVSVPSGVPFKVTLVWTDYPASAGAGSPLVVNDLDLQVVGPEGTFHGNNFQGNWSVDSTVSADADRYNVVENVYIASAAGGSYDLIVHGQQVSQDQEPDLAGINQDFSLVWSAPPFPRCDDGEDNDGDGLTDLNDPGCDDALDDTERSASLICDNGIDDDGDGRTDFDPVTFADPLFVAGSGDPGCRSPTWSLEDPQCQNGVNDDNAIGTDFDGGVSILGSEGGDPNGSDPQCVGRPWRNREAPNQRCGLGFEIAPMIGLLYFLAARRRRAARCGQ